MSSPPPQEFGRQEEEKEEMGQEEKPQEETEDDPQPGGDPPTGVIPKRKRRRLDMKKVDQSKIVDIQSLPANPLLEAPFLKQTALQVKVFVGNKVYVANTGETDVSIPVGTFLCGYGIGKFDRNTKGNYNPDCHLMFKIKTCDDLVHTSKMVTVKQALAETYGLSCRYVVLLWVEGLLTAPISLRMMMMTMTMMIWTMTMRS